MLFGLRKKGSKCFPFLISYAAVVQAEFTKFIKSAFALTSSTELIFIIITPLLYYIQYWS